MRQRNLNKLFDKILWGSLMLLPLIMLIFVNIYPHLVTINRTGVEADQDEVILNNSNVLMEDLWVVLGLSDSEYNYTFSDWSSNSFLYQTFATLFGCNLDDGEFGILSISGNGFIPFYATWLVTVNLLHIAVDFILIVPRVCKKFLDKVGLEE